jgi:hypothetical protein
MGLYPVAVVLQWDNTKKYTSHKITFHTQTEHSTQTYTNNKRHITNNEHNTKT